MTVTPASPPSPATLGSAPSPASTAAVALPEDSLDKAEAVLDSIDALALERHPAAFATFDELLREALESPPRVSSG